MRRWIVAAVVGLPEGFSIRKVAVALRLGVLLWFAGQAAQVRSVRVIWDLSLADGAQTFKTLVEPRAEGHFVGAALGPNFRV